MKVEFLILWLARWTIIDKIILLITVIIEAVIFLAYHITSASAVKCGWCILRLELINGNPTWNISRHKTFAASKYSLTVAGVIMPKHYKSKIRPNKACILQSVQYIKNSMKEQWLMQHIQKQDITSKERKVLFTNKIEVRLTNN